MRWWLVARRRRGSADGIGGGDGRWLITIGHGEISWGMICVRRRENEHFFVGWKCGYFVSMVYLPNGRHNGHPAQNLVIGS